MTAFDLCAPVNMVCVIMSYCEVDIENLAAVHDKPCTVRKCQYLAGFDQR